MNLFPRMAAVILVAAIAAFPVPLAFAKRDAVTPLTEAEIEKAVVVIEVTSQRGDWYSPWQRARSTRANGSGFIIGEGLVMTNAHIVSDAKQIIVRRNGDSTPYFASVEYAAHDSDLALLRVNQPDFKKGVRPLPIGDLPSLRTRVRTYGFPAGGEKISRTEGVVSRIEFITYLHSGADAHLGIQTDSAINPGNSGGPVMQEGKVVGVAFQTNTRLNDVGFFIPTSVVKRFLKDIRDSRYDGYAEMGIVSSNLINPSYRRYLGLPGELTGVVVDRVVPGASADGAILPGDVITGIDGIPVRHLGIQTDSAINPGNSGGPVMQEGKVVGVAFQTNTRLNDVGFFIPTSVVKRFLKDIRDSRYDGYAEMGIVSSNLINPSYRRYLGLPGELTGVVVDRVVPGASADGAILPGDVITGIDGIPVRFDGTIKYFGHSLNFEQIAEEKLVNDKLRLSVWREGELKQVSFRMKNLKDGERLRSNFDVLPSYVIYAGLVFMKLDQEYLKTFGNYWRNAEKSLLYNHFFSAVERPSAEPRETVVLTRILPHKINSAYRSRANSIVSKINDQIIRRLADVPRAFASEKGKYHRIEMEESGIVIIMNRDEANASHKEILDTYGIPQAKRLP